MKKTIVIIILAVYVASIAVVNFFGLEVRQFDSITYVTSIQCDSVIFHGDNSRELEPTQFAGKDGNTPVFVFDFIPAEEGEPYTLENRLPGSLHLQVSCGRHEELSTHGTYVRHQEPRDTPDAGAPGC